MCSNEVTMLQKLPIEPILPDHQRGSVGKRRNGFLPACENCRKAKVRCDITSSETVCNRCRKRNPLSGCVFLQAPMTRTKLDHCLKNGTSPPQSQLPSQSLPTSPGFSIDTPRSNCNVATGNESSHTPGYLGSTSYIATLQHSDLRPPNNNLAGDIPDLDPRKVGLGVDILRHFPDEKKANMYLDYYLTNTIGFTGLPDSSAKPILGSIFATFGTSLKAPHINHELERISRQIITTGQASSSDPDDATEWIESMSGNKIRWEVIGLFYVAFAYAILALSPSEYSLTQEGLAQKDQKDCVREMKSCIEDCIELSRHSLQPMFCNLLYKKLLLESVLEGDSCLLVWRLHYDLVATISAIGLHCYQGSPTVTLRSEMTKRLSASCFWNDKELSMFTGRPPALSHRYYTCPLPLDLHDEVLLEGGEILQREIEALDDNGWNRKGEAYDATRYRVFALFASIQDEVMELFLGAPAQFSIERVNFLKTRAESIYSQIPYLSNVTKDTIRNSAPNRLTWRRFWTRLDYLRIHFLLERLSVERGQESKEKLLEVSREMVDFVTYIWLQRENRLSKHFCDDYTVLCYGIPSAGIICTELIKQVRYPNSYPSSEKLPKSEVVQSLYYMIGFLEWIQPEAGNYKLCRHMAQVIKRVMEQVLDDCPLQEATGDGVSSQELDTSVWDLNGMDDMDMDWLNSIDWGRGTFLDVPATGSWTS